MWTKFLPYIAIVILLGLYVDAKQDVATAIERCNTDKQAAVADAERDTRKTLTAAHNRKISELARQAETKDRALEIAAEELERATSDEYANEATINRLMWEASTDDIPDSKECLNVFIPESSVSGLRVQSGDCTEAVSGGGTRSDSVCSGAEGVDRANSAHGDFSDVTYGDGLKLWGRDRATIQTLNGRLAAIEFLGHGIE